MATPSPRENDVHHGDAFFRALSRDSPLQPGRVPNHTIDGLPGPCDLPWSSMHTMTRTMTSTDTRSPYGLPRTPLLDLFRVVLELEVVCYPRER